MNGRRGRWLLLITAVAQASAPGLVGFSAAGDDPPIVPPAGFFAVWGIVVVGCLTAALWGLAPARATSPPYRRVQVPFSLAQVGFVGWLLVARSPLVELTVPVFALMLAALICSLRVVLATPGDRVTRVLLGGTLGVYAGWSTAAVWVNLATLLPRAGVDARSTAGLALQGVCVVAAAIAAAWGARAFRGQPAYVLTTAWALVGVTWARPWRDSRRWRASRSPASSP